MSNDKLRLDDNHQYWLGDRQIPGVTRTMSPLVTLGGTREQIEAAGVFGQHVHTMTALYDKGDLNEDKLAEELKPYLAGWKLFLQQTGFEVVESEKVVYHDKLCYGGTLDRVGWLQWKRYNLITVLDIKSGAKIDDAVGIQVAGYQDAWNNERPADQDRSQLRVSVHLKPNGKYKLDYWTDKADFATFRALLQIENWRLAHQPPPAKASGLSLPKG